MSDSFYKVTAFRCLLPTTPIIIKLNPRIMAPHSESVGTSAGTDCEQRVLVILLSGVPSAMMSSISATDDVQLPFAS